MKKLNFKVGIMSVSLLGVATTIVLTSGFLSTTPLINAAGSSAVQPLMSAFSNKYTPADLVTQAGGSGAGIRSIIDGTKEIGMASKNPGIIKELDKDKWSDDQIKWIDREIKTVTIAWDGMGLVYKPSKPDIQLDININTIKNIYTAFAGHQQLKYKDIGVAGDETIILPYARSGGSVVSGTADAFYKDSGLKYEVTPEEKEILDNSLNNGAYGRFTKTTAESNFQAWSFFRNENKAGSMVYLSAGFINNNIKEIEREGFKVATYNGISIDTENIAKGYDWYRPLNLMISTLRNQNKPSEFKSEAARELIDWILYDSIPAQIILEGGYIKLTEEEIKRLMCVDNNIENFWDSTDWDIFESNNKKDIKEKALNE
ncbi:MAG: PstS family phosphate ABC transporter substrate-binding protein [Metamycoplasmataceae bacterium]